MNKAEKQEFFEDLKLCYKMKLAELDQIKDSLLRYYDYRVDAPINQLELIFRTGYTLTAKTKNANWLVLAVHRESGTCFGIANDSIEFGELVDFRDWKIHKPLNKGQVDLIKKHFRQNFD